MDKRIELLLSKFPSAIGAKVQTLKPNIPVQFYKGPLVIEYESKQSQCDGIIFFDWLPSPKLRFKLSKLSIPGLSVGKIITMHAVKQRWLLKGFVNHLQTFGGEPPPEFAAITKTERFPASGFVTEHTTTSQKDAHRVLFHIPNFCAYWGEVIKNRTGTTWTGRAQCKLNGWTITIDSLLGDSERDKALEASGGFSVTHVGLLQREKDQSFPTISAKQILRNLGLYLSFVVGRWVSPILREGQSAKGSRLWTDWMPYRNARHKNVHNWFNSLGKDQVLEGFAGFCRYLEDPSWKEPFNLALYWYLESNACSGGQEGSTILAQTALELLAYEVLVNDKQHLSEDGFYKLPASDAIRLLLVQAHIPRDIPPHFSGLNKSAKANGWKDGPAALTEIRNAFIHSNPKKRKKILGQPFDPVYDIWQLALWYLDMLILNLIGYSGQYSDRRIRGGYRGEEVKKVPWV